MAPTKGTRPRGRPKGRTPSKPPRKPPVDDAKVRAALDHWVRKTLSLQAHTVTNDVRKSLATSLILASNTTDPDLAKVYGLIAVSSLKALSEIRCAEIEADADRIGQQSLPRFAAPHEYDATVDEIPMDDQEPEPLLEGSDNEV